MNSNFYLFCLFLYIFCQLETYVTEKVTYIATERPRVVYYNKQFVRNAWVTSRRYSRDDPMYYITIYVDLLTPVGNNVTIDIYFYRFQGNRYHRTIVELHYKFCDFIETTNLFGDTMRKAMAKDPCPYQPGPHTYANLTMPRKAIPSNFPFRQGRIIANASKPYKGGMIKFMEASIDLEERVANGNLKIINKELFNN